MAPQEDKPDLIFITESVGLQEPAPITPPPHANHCTPSLEDRSQGPNPSIAVWIQYWLYYNIQMSGGPMPPINLNFKDMTLSLLKNFVFKHLRNESQSKYPINLIATQAKQAAVLHWAYMVEEPNGSNPLTAHPVPMLDFQEFVQAGENLYHVAKVAIYLEMPEATDKTNPWGSYIGCACM
ncbi:uncharacterized protein PGTG_14022 [Puccinia graminis f. sp. tritici CRL 75-36-700-3]|uniref:Uncharacterized protein n=1 Tax=Puccinia graminis f. sp. tritici (strain CRL 75-36-700-3 / race SCCL) TaxID=418459 RepID=E3KVW9_PUCGT|nr:uncharacterized protein PGTG_14022 [Puccinia graminis f. sp. tritici CRL 75-36-700-3]EFP88444.2 hypothetical protein PGTG_14022 [Puccinia graminis f. sp. tritici CRL 75-36-700-3]